METAGANRRRAVILSPGSDDGASGAHGSDEDTQPEDDDLLEIEHDIGHVLDQMRYDYQQDLLFPESLFPPSDVENVAVAPVEIVISLERNNGPNGTPWSQRNWHTKTMILPPKSDEERGVK